MTPPPVPVILELSLLAQDGISQPSAGSFSPDPSASTWEAHGGLGAFGLLCLPRQHLSPIPSALTAASSEQPS